MKKILLLTPPMTQLNTPYPATAYLKGFLAKRGYEVAQADVALELVLRLFSKSGLERLVSCAHNRSHPSVRNFLEQQKYYINTVDSVIRFMQGRDTTLALRIISRDFLPEGPRFQAMQASEGVESGDPLHWAFGTLGVQDRAKYLASLYIDDLADFIHYGIDEKFELSRYGEKLAASIPTFDPIQKELNAKPTAVGEVLQEVVRELADLHRPDVVGVTAPFPGNVYGAFQIAQEIRRVSPEVKLIFGGGYVNTELRSLSDPRVFDYFDFVTLDDGERPFLAILEFLAGKRKENSLLRTFVSRSGKVQFVNDSSLHDIPQKDVGTPSYQGLKLDRYLSIFEMLNPMHRIWSDGRWNKLTLAHGCYWRKCSFCDVSLDYIQRYDASPEALIVDRMETLIAETGQSGFHFVDEAAPPALLRKVAEKILERGLTVTWWGNVRFDRAFTPELTSLLALSGCVAVTGGLEVASDRLLKLMQKGVTVEQVAKVTQAFAQAGIMVHAYLMYGFPTQTQEETVDALERVRQLFEAGCIHSAYWHRFSVTAHSPIGKNPDAYGIKLLKEPKVSFARNDLSFEDLTGCDHDFLGEGLRKALYNFMLGAGLDTDVRFWFGKIGSRYRVGRAQVPKDLIFKALQ